MAFINAFDDVVVGNTSTTLAQFILSPTQDITGAYVTYELLDENGTIYSTGNGATVNMVPKPNAKVLQSSVTIATPSTMPTNVVGTTYQVRLLLNLTNSPKIELYSNINVLPATLTLEGAADIVDLKGNSAINTNYELQTKIRNI